METIFQKIIRREIPAVFEYEDEQAIAIRDRNPQAPIHCLIIPKKVVPRLLLSEQEDVALLGHLLQISKKLAEKLNVTDFRMVINNGPLAGETVPHLHIHFLAGRSLQWPPG